MHTVFTVRTNSEVISEQMTTLQRLFQHYAKVYGEEHLKR
ncbi:hypothetical protein EDO6_01434 [Paenibacillus xylanexedens]|nr:hypothetical protein EDO6_01434 [Paenibacillus xylanexedens]